VIISPLSYYWFSLLRRPNFTSHAFIASTLMCSASFFIVMLLCALSLFWTPSLRSIFWKSLIASTFLTSSPFFLTPSGRWSVYYSSWLLKRFRGRALCYVSNQYYKIIYLKAKKVICNIQEKQQMFINCNSLLCSINSIVFGAGQVMGFFWCCANCLERHNF